MVAQGWIHSKKCLLGTVFKTDDVLIVFPRVISSTLLAFLWRFLLLEIFFLGDCTSFEITVNDLEERVQI